MADEDLTVKARIDDELTRPLENIREKVEDLGGEAESSSRRASRSSRGWDTFGRATERAGKLAHKAGQLAKRALIGIGAGIAAATYAAGRLAMSSIRQASDLNESLNAVNVTYGKQASAVKKLGREAAKSLGLSNVEFNAMAVQFSSFAQAIGGKGAGSVKILDKITGRAADFASVMNIEVSEATELFQSGLAGESEPLRRYGINLSAAAVGAYAVDKGLAKSATTMTDAAKVQATYGLLMEKTANTQGDFSNTSDQLANQQRILGARFDNAQAKLGKGLLPVMQTGVKWLNREGIPAFLDFSDWFTDKGIPAIGRFVDKARTFYEKHGPQIKDTLSDVRDVTQGAADAATQLVGAFLDMPSWVRKALVGGAIGGAVGKKLGLYGLGKSLGKGLVATATGSVQKVFVVNMTGGGGLGGGLPGKVASVGASAWGKVAGLAMKASIVAGGIVAADAIWTKFHMDDSDIMKPIGDAGKNVHDWAVDKFGNKKTTKTQANGEANPWASLYEGDPKKVSARIDAALDATRAKAAGLGKELDLVGDRKVTPLVNKQSINDANDALAVFIGKQIEAGRPVAPYITIDGYAQAMQQISTLTVAIHSLPSMGTDNGLTYASGGNRPAAPGGGDGKNGRTQLTTTPGRRHPSMVTSTLTPRTSAKAGGSITIADGAIRVDARGASSDVDVAGAVKRGIESWMRDREERR